MFVNARVLFFFFFFWNTGDQSSFTKLKARETVPRKFDGNAIKGGEVSNDEKRSFKYLTTV